MTLLVSSLDFPIRAASGGLPSVGVDFRFGFIEKLSATTTADVWFPSGSMATPQKLFMEFPTTASKLNLVSDDANDTIAGTGAREILIRGVDANFEDLPVEVLPMNGLTPVQSLQTYLRSRVDVFTVGELVNTATGGGNKGNIAVTRDSDSALVDVIGIMTDSSPAVSNYSSALFVPKGKKAYIKNVVLNVETVQTMDFTFNIRDGNPAKVALANKPPVNRSARFKQISGLMEIDISSNPFVIPEMTDAWFGATSGAGISDAQVLYGFVIVDEEF